ncbi:MAG: metal ABC transporter ATP-binding protein [Lentisphaeria bacterium]|nr:metal ABC transporter ATP-binding protein [Lentisphaeria bacterium]
MNAVVFRDVSVGNNDVKILQNVNAVIPHAGCTAIVGPNGAGKTTLVLALLNETDYTGTIEFCSNRRPRIGYVPQHLAFDRGMPLTVLEFIAAFHQKLPLCFGIRKELKKRLHELLGETGCLHLENRPLGALSGGELQRVMLAGALSQEPELLILDEPASGIDFKGGEVCCELLERFRKTFGFTQLMVTHDLNTVMAHATHVICLNRTLIAEGEPHKVLSDKVLAKAFGPHVGCSCGKDHSNNG